MRKNGLKQNLTPKYALKENATGFVNRILSLFPQISNNIVLCSGKTNDKTNEGSNENEQESNGLPDHRLPRTQLPPQ